LLKYLRQAARVMKLREVQLENFCLLYTVALALLRGEETTGLRGNAEIRQLFRYERFP